MGEEKTLEGWEPAIGRDGTLEDIIEMAVDYRGNVTIIKRGGVPVVGYLSNRDRDARPPFVQYFDEQGNGPLTLLYSEIEMVKFTGKDTAAGKSWEAWLKRKDKGKTSEAKI